MAQGRMFSTKLISSARFIKMPISCQNLYFHLNLNADDDGVVEAFNVMRMIGATEDDLKVLVAKKFVVVLNEDLVTYILDWRVNNKIRPDRKVDSMYKGLLLQIIPDIDLLESRARVDVKKIDGSMDNQWTTNGQPMDNQRTTNGQEMGSIGKVRLGKDSIDNNMSEVDSTSGQADVFISLILNNKTEYPISKQQVEQWKELYPSVNVEQELRNMKGWLLANPTKRKTSKGILRFINSWLSREQDKGGNRVSYINVSSRKLLD